MDGLNIRSVTKEDTELLFNWRNDPYIVKMGSLQRTVTWDEHTQWVEGTISSNERKAFIIELNSSPAGQVRFDKNEKNSCFISVYLLQAFSGKGYGARVILEGCSRIFIEWPRLETVFALVRRENINGQKVFLKAGFEPEKQMADIDHFAYRLNRC